jgi:hypothetical protein
MVVKDKRPAIHSVKFGRSPALVVDTHFVSSVEQMTISVSSYLYDSVEVGGNICAAIHAGALGTSWFSVKTCYPS